MGSTVWFPFASLLRQYLHMSPATPITGRPNTTDFREKRKARQCLGWVQTPSDHHRSRCLTGPQDESPREEQSVFEKRSSTSDSASHSPRRLRAGCGGDRGRQGAGAGERGEGHRSERGGRAEENRGMELFEEALRRWEQALTFRSRQAEEEACSSVKLGAGDAIAEESVDDIISTEFIHKLEALLQRAYRLQEEFEATLGGSDPNSLANDTDKDTDVSMKETMDDFGLQDTLNSESDLFASAAELPEHREARHTYSLESFCRCPFYEEAMHLVEEGKIYSRVLRTELLECLGDSDFLAKLHCVRQAFQVKNLNFYDVVLDFILMDSFEDLENPPPSIQSVVSNRWLNSSFKETNQVLFFLKDIFDFEKVRYSSIDTLAEDLSHLLIRRTELLVACLGADALRHATTCTSGPGHAVPNTLVEGKVQ
ncbi:mitoguardin 1 [Cricetulus griseus]